MTAPKHLFILSDGTGLSAETAARAALAQLPLEPTKVVFHRYAALDFPVLREAVLKAAALGGVVVHTLGERRLAHELETRCRALGLPCLDVLGGVVDLLAHAWSLEARETPREHHRLDAHYFRRVEAMEFAVSFDDGRLPERMVEADLVLVGVSRASKTPLSIYLAGRGYKVANLPLVPGIEPPAQLWNLPRARVFGLRIDALVLLEIRRNRLRHLGAGTGEYAHPRNIQKELEYAETIFLRGRFAVLEVTGRAVEETAADIERRLERIVPFEPE